jgi:hypothetical protein
MFAIKYYGWIIIVFKKYKILNSKFTYCSQCDDKKNNIRMWQKDKINENKKYNKIYYTSS